MKDTFKKCSYFDKVMTLMSGLFYFYKKSHKNQQGLRESFKALDIQGVQPPRVGGTKWVGHITTGLTALFGSYAGIHAHLSSLSHRNPKAEGLCKLVISKDIVNVMLFLQVCQHASGFELILFITVLYFNIKTCFC